MVFMMLMGLAKQFMKHTEDDFNRLYLWVTQMPNSPDLAVLMDDTRDKIDLILTPSKCMLDHHVK